MKKTTNLSILKQISTESLQKILDNSTSLSNAITNIGVDGLKTYYIDILRDRILNEKLSTVKMAENYQKIQRSNAGFLPHDNVFISGSKHSRGVIRHKVFKYKLIEYRCSECPVVDTYNGKPVSLQLDHINGVRNDHRLENLRWLCPTCHSQQGTSFGKGKGNNKPISLCECGNVKKHYSNNCSKCANKLNGVASRKFEINKEELMNLVLKYSMTTVGSKLGVSDNAVKKRCIKLGIDLSEVKKMKKELKNKL
mgnify:CR=1 FL=1